MPDNEIWFEKYRPDKLSGVLGSQKNITTIREWADSFKGGGKPTFPALLLIGPPGVGKTSAAIATANDYKWPLTEFNASNIRTYDALMQQVAPLVLTRPIKGGIFRKMILLDEVDSLHDENGKQSTTAPNAIVKILKVTKHPIIMTCNDAFAVHPKIKDMCILITWRRMNESTIRKVLINILKKENLEFPIEDINTCITKGDLRASINNLQVLATSNIPVAQMESIKPGSPWDFVREVFTSTDMNRLAKVTSLSDMKPEDMLLWISENVTLFYRGIEVVNAYEQLSKADLYFQQARQSGNYQYWRLAIRHMTLGVALARKRKVSEYYVKLRNPSWLVKMKETKYHRETVWKKGALAHKLGRMFNMSSHTMMSTTFPLIQKLCIENPLHMLELKLVLDLNEHEIAAVLDTTTLDPRIQKFMNPDLKISDETQAIIERHQNKQKPVLSFFRFKGDPKPKK